MAHHPNVQVGPIQLGFACNRFMKQLAYALVRPGCVRTDKLVVPCGESPEACHYIKEHLEERGYSVVVLEEDEQRRLLVRLPRDCEPASDMMFCNQLYAQYVSEWFIAQGYDFISKMDLLASESPPEFFDSFYHTDICVSATKNVFDPVQAEYVKRRLALWPDKRRVCLLTSVVIDDYRPGSYLYHYQVEIRVI